MLYIVSQFTAYSFRGSKCSIYRKRGFAAFESIFFPSSLKSILCWQLGASRFGVLLHFTCRWIQSLQSIESYPLRTCLQLNRSFTWFFSDKAGQLMLSMGLPTQLGAYVLRFVTAVLVPTSAQFAPRVPLLSVIPSHCCFCPLSLYSFSTPASTLQLRTVAFGN